MKYRDTRSMPIALTDAFIGEAGDDGLPTLDELVANLYTKVGQSVFDKYSMAELKRCFDCIFTDGLQIAIVHQSVVSDAEPWDILPFLVAQPSNLEDLLVRGMEFDGTTKDMAQIDQRPHNKALKDLTGLAEVFHLTSLSVPFVAHSDPAMTAMDLEAALLMSGLWCKMVDLASLAAHVHVHFVRLCADGGRNLGDDAMCSSVAFELRALSLMVGIMEDAINSEVALAVERAAWKPKVPFGDASRVDSVDRGLQRSSPNNLARAGVEVALGGGGSLHRKGAGLGGLLRGGAHLGRRRDAHHGQQVGRHHRGPQPLAWSHAALRPSGNRLGDLPEDAGQHLDGPERSRRHGLLVEGVASVSRRGRLADH